MKQLENVNLRVADLRGRIGYPFIVKIEDFQPINLQTIQTRTNDELLFMLYSLPASTEWKEWIAAELAHRQANRLSEALNDVENAILQVGLAVKDLTKSSERLENLTVRLKFLTWVLIVLTALAIITPIGIEVWRAYRDVPATL